MYMYIHKCMYSTYMYTNIIVTNIHVHIDILYMSIHICYVGIIGTVFVLVIILILIFLGKKIRISIAIIQEAARYIKYGIYMYT